MSTYPNLGLTRMSEGQLGAEIVLNSWLRFIDIMLMGRAQDYRATATPPASPAEGDTYIIAAATPSGDWASASQYDIAAYYDAQWVFITPHAGFQIWVVDESKYRVFNGTNWSVGLTPS